MIGFTNKQYWNDFNNWDEALFQDANRPRDEDKFKIQPWLQSDKWNWKATNKNRMPSMFHVYWYSLVTWANPANNKATDWIVWKRVRFKSEYTNSDFSGIAPYAAANTKTYSANDLLTFVWDAYWENWDAKAIVKDEYLEIVETWIYFIDMFAQFIYPNWYWYSTWTTYPLYLWLILNGSIYAYTQGRSCFYIDRLHETFATPIPKWSKLSLWIAHWYTSAPILVACWITAVRMD